MKNKDSGEKSNTPRRSNRGNRWSRFVAYMKRHLEQRRAKRQQETAQDRAARRTATATAWMAAFTCIAIIVGGFQFLVMRGQLDVLENQTTVMTAQERPWLTVEMDKTNSLSVQKDGSAHQAFNFIVKNVGSTPAIEAMVWARLMPVQPEGFPFSILAGQDVLCGHYRTPESPSILPIVYGFSIFPGQERPTVAVAMLSAKDIRSTSRILKGQADECRFDWLRGLSVLHEPKPS